MHQFRCTEPIRGIVGVGDHIEVSSVLGAVRRVAIIYHPIIFKDLDLKPLVPTSDEGDNLIEVIIEPQVVKKK